MGGATTASGNNSVSMGGATTASGNNSVSMGGATTASGNNSVSMGDVTTASGVNSVAMGNNTTASGQNSVAMGNNTTASSDNMLVIGQYNDTSTNALFVIGNGESSSNKSDALVVDNNGSLNVDTIQPNGTKGNIIIQLNSSPDLEFIRKSDGNTLVARIDDGKTYGTLDFTGQHRCFIKDIPYTSISNEYIGRIVSADQNTNISMSGSIKKGNQAITQNETLPYVSLSNKNRDKSCFGVISASEDPDERVDKYGAFCTPFEKEKGDTRVYINSVGEGAIWVINKNGPLESGDYITTCDISGYGVKQDDDILHNYSVAKITMDCNFTPLYQPVPAILKDASGENILDAYGQIQWTNALGGSGNIIYEYEYNIRYINEHGEETNEPSTYIAAYVGCTYHCG